MRLICFSDAHLDAYTSGVERFDDICAAVWDVFEAARAERADALIFTGDWCDPDDGASALRCSAVAVRLAREASCVGMRSYWVAGNHDVVTDGTGTTTLTPLRRAGIPGCHVAEEPCVWFPGGDVMFIALPYTAPDRGYDPGAVLRSIEDRCARTVVLSHLMLEGIIPGVETTDMARGRNVVLPVAEAKRLFPGVLVLNGHFHKRQVFNGVQIVGALSRHTHGEEDHEPGFLIIDV